MKQDSWALGQILFRLIYNDYPFPCMQGEVAFMEGILDFEESKDPYSLFPKNVREIPEQYKYYQEILVGLL